MLKYIKERLNDYNANTFINELASAAKELGILETKINTYQFDYILLPMLHKKEAISTMDIEGTETTIYDVFENNVNPLTDKKREMDEVRNHSQAIQYGTEFLQAGKFTHTLIKELHSIILKDIVPERERKFVEKYKTEDNKITNSAGTTIFIPPSHTETKKYMDELIDYMNDSNDGIHPLVKAAIIHS